MPFFIISGIASAVAGVAGAAISSSGAQSAAKTQAQASQHATDVQQAEFQQIQGLEQPFVQAGTTTLAQLLSGIGAGGGNNSGTGALNAPFTAADYQQSPGYNFQFQQGEQAILDAQSATGGVNSGNTLKELTSYGQGVANQDYWQAYQAYVNAQNQKFSQLDTVVASGQNAVADLSAAGQNTANNVSNNIIGSGNAQAASQVAGANAASSAVTGGLSSLSNSYLLSQLLGGGGGNGSITALGTAAGGGVV